MIYQRAQQQDAAGEEILAVEYIPAADRMDVLQTVAAQRADVRALAEQRVLAAHIASLGFPRKGVLSLARF